MGNLAFPISADRLNRTLMLRRSLNEFSGISKMNDVLAVDLFTFPNLLKLWEAKDYMSCKYMLPFVLWYGGISIGGLPPRTRILFFSLAFRCLGVWLAYAPKVDRSHKIICSDGQRRRFVAEACDLRRYLNTLLFLIHVTSVSESIAFNRIGSHPLENAFGLIRLQSKNRHKCRKMLRVVARG